ncbi:hypothetical protein SAMN06266787_103232 [Halorubrum ezzemoulense]|jgi:hypothetical protein|uniref:Uncharacterized protein n=1 Tax=Halorubrum ezzemoulense TaxID=337243 RepID=A0A238X5M9_HALEZ|nr:hypothetical protein SAMN06266787_103232 [Halorubrum ezzemoulense]
MSDTSSGTYDAVIVGGFSGVVTTILAVRELQNVDL